MQFSRSWLQLTQPSFSLKKASCTRHPHFLGSDMASILPCALQSRMRCGQRVHSPPFSYSFPMSHEQTLRCVEPRGALLLGGQGRQVSLMSEYVSLKVSFPHGVQSVPVPFLRRALTITTHSATLLQKGYINYLQKRMPDSRSTTQACRCKAPLERTVEAILARKCRQRHDLGTGVHCLQVYATDANEVVSRTRNAFQRDAGKASVFIICPPTRQLHDAALE